ncbi:MAG: hypothetical protein OEU74_08200, partial [Gammaproteobacteria bacterium]|nr:hypothetical protein [Gammaproteobacteria bacterium]
GVFRASVNIQYAKFSPVQPRNSSKFLDNYQHFIMSSYKAGKLTGALCGTKATLLVKNMRFVVFLKKTVASM